MHMGAMAIIGSQAPQNFIHILINNGAHESVGGMPTVADKIDFLEIAKGCGYKKMQCVFSIKDLEEALAKAVESRELYFIEIQTRIGSRSDLSLTSIGAETLNRRIFFKCFPRWQNTRLRVMEIGSMNHHRQQISHPIHYNVSLASFCFFPRPCRALVRSRWFLRFASR